MTTLRDAQLQAIELSLRVLSRRFDLFNNVTSRADADPNWDESLHPRAKDGKFGSGNGGHAAVKSAMEANQEKRNAEKRKRNYNRLHTGSGGKKSELEIAYEKTADAYAEAELQYRTGLEEKGIISHKKAEKLASAAEVIRSKLAAGELPTKAETPPAPAPQPKEIAKEVAKELPKEAAKELPKEVKAAAKTEIKEQPKQSPPETKSAPAKSATGSKSTQKSNPELMAKVLERPYIHKLEKEHTARAFTHASDNVTKALANIPALFAVNNDYAGNTSYDSNNHAMNWADSDRGKGEQDDIWRHEMGHALDLKMGKRGPESDRRGGHTAMREDMDNGTRARIAKTRPPVKVEPEKLAKLLDSAGIDAQEFKEHTKGSSKHVEALYNLLNGGKITDKDINFWSHPVSDEYKTSLLHDYVNAASKNLLGQGHSEEYYSRNPQYRAAEGFANYFSLTTGKGGNIYKAILNNLTPSACKVWDKMIEDAANGNK